MLYTYYTFLNPIKIVLIEIVDPYNVPVHKIGIRYFQSLEKAYEDAVLSIVKEAYELDFNTISKINDVEIVKGRYTDE